MALADSYGDVTVVGGGSYAVRLDGTPYQLQTKPLLRYPLSLQDTPRVRTCVGTDPLSTNPWGTNPCAADPTRWGPALC